MLVIPGMPVMMGGNLGIRFIGGVTNSQRGTSGGRTVNMSIPAGAEPGDLIIVHATASGVSTKTVALPAGCTNIDNASRGGTAVPSYRFFYRVMEEGDTVITVTSDAGLVLMASLQVWRGAALGERRVTVSPTNFGNVAAEIVSTSEGSAMAVFGQMCVSGGENYSPVITGPGSSTFVSQQTSGGLGGCAHWSGYELELPGGGTGTRAFTDDISASFEYWNHVLQELLPA